MRGTCLAIVEFVKRNTLFFCWYFEVRVRYRRKKVHGRYLIF